MEHMYVVLPLKDVLSKTSIEVFFFFPLSDHLFYGPFQKKKKESRRSRAFCLTSIISNKTNNARYICRTQQGRCEYSIKQAALQVKHSPKFSAASIYLPILGGTYRKCRVLLGEHIHQILFHVI